MSKFRENTPLVPVSVLDQYEHFYVVAKYKWTKTWAAESVSDISKGPFTPKGYYAIAIGWTTSWLMFCTVLGGYIYTENYFNYCNYH